MTLLNTRAPHDMSLQMCRHRQHTLQMLGGFWNAVSEVQRVPAVVDELLPGVGGKNSVRDEPADRLGPHLREGCGH